MSLSVNELNYLIWRYLQEGGLEVSAYALQDETRINEYDSKYNQLVPLGCLVDLVQKGIFYTKINEFVVAKADKKELVEEDVIDLDFNLFGALSEEEKVQTSERKITKDNENGHISVLPGLDKQQEITKPSGMITANNIDEKQKELTKSAEVDPNDQFTKVLHKYCTYPASLSTEFSPTDSSILAWGQRDHYSTICTLNNSTSDSSKAETNKKLLPHSITSKDSVCVEWSPSGKSLLTASENGELRLWDSNGSMKYIMAMHHAPVVSVKWSPNGKHVLSLDVQNNIVIWNTENGNLIMHIDKSSLSNEEGLNGFIDLDTDTMSAPVCFGTDACWIDNFKFVVPGPGYSMLVCQVTNDNTNAVIGVLTGHEDSISTIRYNSKLKLLCSASDDQSIRIWKGNSTNSLQILLGHSQPITYLNWLTFPENDSEKWYLISCSLDSSIRIWDFVNNKIIDLKLVENGLPILYAVLSNDSGSLASGDSEGNVIIFEIELKNRLPALKQVGLYQPEFSKESNFISGISWNKDNTKLSVSYSGLESVVISV